MCNAHGDYIRANLPANPDTCIASLGNDICDIIVYYEIEADLRKGRRNCCNRGMMAMRSRCGVN